jgi:hypothetical protein
LEEQAEWTIYGDNWTGHLGGAISAGDFDGDGNIEIILGCTGCNPQGAPTYVSGAIYIIEPESIYGTQPITSASQFSVEGFYPGSTVVASDLDKDGYDEIVFSALGDDDDNIPAKVFILSYPFRQTVYIPLIVKN